ncbi:MAG: pentapeptide repeat-containing protein, partial [Angustibacter sp.]
MVAAICGAIVGVLELVAQPLDIVLKIRQVLDDDPRPSTAPTRSSALPTTRPSYSADPLALEVLPNYQLAQKELVSNDLEVRLNAILNLGEWARSPAAQPERRRQILQRMTFVVATRSPPIPKSNPADYCYEQPPPEVAADVQAALNVIGRRLEADASEPINLSGANIAYASLVNLDLRNITFDAALACRAMFTGSNIDGATFRSTNIGWAE